MDSPTNYLKRSEVLSVFIHDFFNEEFRMRYGSGSSSSFVSLQHSSLEKEEAVTRASLSITWKKTTSRTPKASLQGKTLQRRL
jgi:hypothetical protein